MVENLVSGLVSGLIVVLITLVISRVWTLIVVPWFEERVYKDVKIEGKWFSYYTGGMLGRQEVITLKRHGHQITGTMVCTNIGQPDHGEQYNIHGTFKNLILPLVYENDNQSKTDRGTITLKSTFSAKKLVGQISYYSCREDIINTSIVTWYRTQEDMEAAKNSHETRLKEGFNPQGLIPTEDVVHDGVDKAQVG
ncbi:hypothetical protein JKP11_21720 [Vibrio vulnificus]|uniref:hypothetical protein n=1 Tax=Vibrio vulnificus TaxID=672 RepID=UPI001CDD57D1|nr:hypothetical protein [Vibrio vulnificus]EGR0671656.1 hypothetical protein [Vibrio vulnificus]MCA3958255.1 hypothetical protein [Vibrio vulnificus]